MATYPAAIPSIAANKTDQTTSASDHAAHHNTLAAELVAALTELGVNPSGAAATVAARLTSIDDAITTLNGLVGGLGAPDATTLTKGIVRLAGDLGGTASSPTVPGLAGKANTSHSHAIADTTGLQTALDGKAATSHTHAQTDITGLAASLSAKVDTSDARLTDARMPSVFPWIPIFQAHVNLTAAAAGLYPGHQDVTANLISTAASPAQFAVVMHYIDPTDYAVAGKTLRMRVVASFMQNAVANAATSVATAGLYPVTGGGTTTTFLPTYGAVVTGSTAAKTGGAASSESRVVSSAFNAPAADHYALAVAIATATTAGATTIGLRLEYSYA